MRPAVPDCSLRTDHGTRGYRFACRTRRAHYCFLAVKIETHATFKRIDHATTVSSLINAPDRVAVSSQDFFDCQRERWVNLHDRFVWCVLCVWTHLSDADVEEFRRLKKCRDD